MSGNDTITKSLSLSYTPDEMGVNATLNHLYLANGQNFIEVREANTGNLLGTINFPSGVSIAAIATDPSRGYIYAAGSAGSHSYVLRIRTRISVSHSRSLHSPAPPVSVKKDSSYEAPISWSLCAQQQRRRGDACRTPRTAVADRAARCDAAKPRNIGGSKSKTFLFVGILGGGPKANFLVYPIDALKPLRKFDVYLGVAAMAIDRWGDIYTTNGFPSGGSITAFTPGGHSVLLSFIAYPVNALAFDRRGHLYAASVGVGEYRPRSSKLIRGLGEGIHNPDALAVDGSRNVYVASDSNSSSGLGKGSIEVFPPHGKQLPIAPAAMSAIQKVQ